MTRTLKYLLFGLLLFLPNTLIYGQQFPLTSHYLFNPYTLSPSFAGTKSDGSFFLNYRKDWLNFTGSPITARFNADFHIGNNMYLGSEIFLDEVDVFQRFKGSLSYTYRLQMANSQFLHFGLWGSIYQNTINFDRINGHTGDPLFQNADQLSKMNYNTGFGLLYINKELYIGLGMPTVIRTKDAYSMQSQGNFAFEQEFLFHISNTFNLGEQFQLMPFAVVRRTTNQPTVVDVSASFIFNKQYWISALYRNSQAVSIGAGGALFETLQLNYSYEFAVSGLTHRPGGAHEISLGFRFGSKESESEVIPTKQKKQKNKKYMLHEYQQLYEQKYRRQ